MRKVLILLAVAALPLNVGCCARLCSTCPLCPCNWFNRQPVCAPAPTFAAPLAATPCAPTYVPSPCAPVCAPAPAAVSPLAATVMPQYVAPQAMPMMTQAPPVCCQPAQMCCPPEPSCCYSAEPSCGGPYMGAVSYGPADCGGCGSCGGGCGGGCGGSSGGCSSCDGGASAPIATPAPAPYNNPPDPAPAPN